MGKEPEVTEGVVHHLKYRGENLYVYISETVFDMSMLDMDKSMEVETSPRTLTSLGIISGLVTLCLEAEVSKEIVASNIFKESRSEKDLADVLSKALVQNKGREYEVKR